MISSDRNILKEGSEVQGRMREYGTLVEELRIIVFARRNFQFPISNFQTSSKIQISKNVWVYSTHSRSKWLYVFDAYKIAKQIIENWDLKIGNSVITAQDPFETGFAGWLIARHCKAPLQLQIHTDFLSPYFSRESFVNRIRVMLARFLIPRTARIRVVSERIKRSLSNVKCQMSNVSVLPIFVDTEKIKNAPIRTDLHKKYQQFDFIALMASRFTKEKNIPLALAAIREVIKKHPKVGLVIVGEGPEKESLMFHVSSFMLQESVKFEPWTDDLASYYKTADLFLLTSVYEGYGRTVVEAQACGLPVVMTDVGIAGETVKDGENGLVVPVGDASALADAVLSVVGKKTILQASLPEYSKKEEYLRAYLASWESALHP